MKTPQQNSDNSRSIEVKGKRVSSNQNERTLGAGGGVLENKERQTRGDVGVKTQES